MWLLVFKNKAVRIFFAVVAKEKTIIGLREQKS
jgi:hypothetical protein